MWKSRLFTPGPTAVPDEVLLEMARPLIHHRTPQFRKLLKEAFEGLKYVFQTGQDVMILTSSGTGAMEAAVANLLSPGDHCLVVEGGKFGERFRELAQAYGAAVKTIPVEWGRSVSAGAIEAALKSDPAVKVVFTTLCETSTGAHLDLKAIGAAVRQHPETLLVVDAISSLGAVECRMDEWGVDALISASQKAFMLPPGLAFIALSPKAWKAVEAARSPRYYFDLSAYRQTLAKEDTPYTPALTLVIGLVRVLRMMKEEGLENVWRRHRILAEATREAMRALGLKLLAEHPSDGLTAVLLPEGLDAEAMVKALRDQSGITFAGGQGKLKGRIFRIAHMGWVDGFEVLEAIAAVEIQLARLGYGLTPGAGVAAAEKVLLSAGG
ncbi:MAG TPA: alanine--glyoxylate aminotransferase family protein [bacterium]|uniref:Soluble hydrogenase 42 kDa subunit n=1 Tax=candidate division TA06 bacterium ADurb.Bin417 TaxID=1852828 RepID=A0A1V5MI94_UNCT6|nr:MAG: Soluble hydrogenase 42 kDa subunit [candidate division TA06 bacterium ADurb.Bin417]HNQ34437.1 alanine--glyoxylate aminotransferase family protein [bacterium]HNS48153.1 alanine--glyoxylate aminotransferase family protein [bacterium]